MSRLNSFSLLLGRHAKSRGSGSQGTDEFRWEEIMVQITFAFVIILGYLLSSRTEEARDLGSIMKEQEEKRREQEARGDQLEKLIREARNTDLGQARASQVSTEKQLQLEKLLRIWAQRRVDRPLYRHLRRFENAETIPLNGTNYLPVSESFQELNRESARVFLVPGENLSANEIVALVTDVLRHAGFDLTATERAVDPDLLPVEATQLYFDKKLPTRENLRVLKLRIIADLATERKELYSLQCALVGRIAAARRDKLASIPLSQAEATVPEETDLGLHMLKAVLEDLKNEMKLLPETIANIQQAGISRRQSGK